MQERELCLNKQGKIRAQMYLSKPLKNEDQLFDALKQYYQKYDFASRSSKFKSSKTFQKSFLFDAKEDNPLFDILLKGIKEETIYFPIKI